MAAWLPAQDRFYKDSELLVVTPTSVMLGRVVDVATGKNGEKLVVLSMRPFDLSKGPASDDTVKNLIRKATE